MLAFLAFVHMLSVCLPAASGELTCATGDGSAYRGAISVTETGKTCQMWASQEPHGHDRTPKNHPSKGLTLNYCRNPDNEMWAWCYTTDPSTRWEYCKVPTCGNEPGPASGELTCATGDGSAYRGAISVTETGKTCQMWASQEPHGHDRTPKNHPSKGLTLNYCRNPDNEMWAWCYTTDPSTRWEYCKVPTCGNEPGPASGELTCATGDGSAYRGAISVTETGKTCQMWASQEPHGHSRTPENNPSKGLTLNYCRNPDNEMWAWCYTTDPSTRWEYCKVPTCGNEPGPASGELTCATGDGSAYRGAISVTETGKTCQMWASQEPHGHSRTPENHPSKGLTLNYCRNPDNEMWAWCYTTDPSTRWEYCKVPTCGNEPGPGMNNFLVVAWETHIRMVSLDTPDFVDVLLPVNVSMMYTTAVGVDPKEGKVYWSDAHLDKVSRANLDGTEYEDIISTGLQDVNSLVVDEVGRKIYWTDWATNRIEVANLDGSMRKVLIWENLDQPWAIELYQEMGYMYWTTTGEHAKLERSGMDGSERVVLISKGLYSPGGLAIDKAGSRLLWADYSNRRIETAGLNGANRRTLLSGVNPRGLTLLGPYIYWTDQMSRSIRRADKTTGANGITVRDNLPNLWGIQAVDRERLPSSNRCGQKNGGCSHLCLPHPNGTSCACPTGILLRGDGRTCNETYLLFSNHVSVHRISLDTADRTDVPLPELHNVTSLDYDSIEGKVYYTDVNINHIIRRANLDGSGMETVVEEGLTTTNGLAVDWVARNMYWTDTGRNTIEVARLNGSARKVLINDSLDEPRAIAVFPSKGYVFWTGWGSISKIERAHLDGSDRRVLVNTNLTWPEGLTLDYDTQRIFWVDARLNRIESSDLNGNLRQILVSQLSNPIGITQHDRWIYWIDSSSIQRVDKLTGGSKETVLAGVEGLKDIIVVSPQRQTGTNHCGGVHNGGCTHLCLAKSDGFTCACPDTPDSRPCSTGMGNFLVVARKTDIRMVSLDTPDFVDVVLAVNVSMESTTAVGVDPKEGKVYWSDAHLDKVSRANLDGTEYEDIISTGLQDVNSLVVDEVGRKIYWTDWATNRIEVANLDGSMRKVLIWENLDQPWAIELYQEMGYMYWTTTGEHAKLERSGMDGSERVVLISKGLYSPGGLAIDKAGSQLLWADYEERRIETAGLNGANRRTLLSGVKPRGLTLLGPYIYWTDQTSRSIRRADKTTGANAITVRDNLPNLWGIQAVDRERLPSSNRCGQKNGGCSHLCLPHPNGTSCACPTGILLRGDGRTCNETYLLFSNHVSVRRISLDTADRTDVPLPELNNVTSLDYDSIEGKVYYTDVNINQIIRRANLDGSGMETVVGEGLTTTNGLAVDWVARNMYWTDRGHNTIEVARLNGSARKVLINDSLDEPRAIAVFPSKGYVFWTGWGSISKIERAHLDGSDRRVLVNTNLTWPEGLTLDYDTQRIFWVDARLNRIESSDLNGNFRQILVSQLSNPIGITQHDRWIYWIDSSSIQRVDKITGERKVMAGVVGLKDIIVVSPQRQTGTNHCGGVHNGGCTHLCLAKSDGFTCACPDTPDSRPCSTAPVMSGVFRGLLVVQMVLVVLVPFIIGVIFWDLCCRKKRIPVVTATFNARKVDGNSSMGHVSVNEEEADYENEPAFTGPQQEENVYECINEEEHTLPRNMDDDSSMGHISVNEEEQDAFTGPQQEENVYV